LELCKPFPHTELNLIDKTKTIPPTVQKFCYVEDFSKFINIVTFHQSYGYEEFIEGIRPEVKNKVLSYPIKKGIFQKICNQARNSKDNHVLIIDEINRGNISKIFGELITIIENDKRGDEVTLAYSDDPFSVPDNVYVIGTMNTADQSLTHIDAALKRRFSSIEVMPNSLILKKGMKGLPELLDKINEKVREKISRDNQIGHSYFMQDGKPITEIRDLQFVFATDIIPLLRDYFYDSDDDLKEVLGEQFIDWNEGSDRNVEEDWQNNPEIFRTAIEKAYDVKI
jgi:5-methylcytosine-specific restriction protein B